MEQSTANGRRILVADDDPGALLVADAALSGAGFEVITVADGAAAVAAIADCEPDCVILDVMMPAMNGIDACREIRGRMRDRRLPILILTGRNDLAAISDAFAAGATDFAQKGMNPRLLVERVLFLLRDRDTQDELWLSRSRLLHAQRLARVGHWEFDTRGSTIRVSPMVGELLELGEASPVRYDDLLALLEAQERDRVRAAFDACAAEGAGFSFDHILRTARGREICVHQEGELLRPAGASAAPVVMVTLQDLTRLHRAEETVRLLSFFDAATGLPNQHFLLDQVAGALNDDAGARASAVVAVRLHQFDQLVRAQGARFTNALVAQVGRKLEAELARACAGGEILWRIDRPGVCRIAEGELAVLLRSRVSLEHLAGVARAMLAAVSTRTVCLETEYVPAASVGIALWPLDGDDAELLLGNARAAARQAGDARNCEFFSTVPQERSRRRMQLESALREAVARGEMHVVYQPRVAATTLDLAGVECLARWENPQFGKVSPQEFITLAEEIGVIDEIGRWVLEQSCRQLAAWRKRFQAGFRLAVNLSPRQLADPNVVGMIHRVLADTRLPASVLEIEITESCMVDAPEQARQKLAALRASGVRIALDDFGTGHSSLGQIRRLPFDCLKLDRSLVADLRTDTGARDVTTAVVAMARALRIRSVAEGVEDAPTLELLRDLGCDEIQGFHLAQPMKAADFERWYDAGGARNSGLQRTG